ncbi:restriction endonuclease [Paenibacillus psychroresistens]|uniref:Restriction endonuclease n=1 Tax=Paenibacillus psychroresistens TaxID=1778678 RepID=A0A6B8RK69_9BACL|nr:BglII/BstYI family type II restriction endonuclease [Paenibacillus psychroresistens]QGQ95816.1 restriction endonuclease [Paenibacillus psychroresistens]
MKLRLEYFSYRFAEQIINSKFTLKQEIDQILLHSNIDIPTLTRPNFNKVLLNNFLEKGWKSQPSVFDEPDSPAAKMDFLKERIGIEVGFGHASFMGIDLLKFQVASYSALNKIDLGVYIVTTKNFQKKMTTQHNQNWEGSLNFEKVVKYLPHFKSAIQVPVYVIGIDL